MNRKILLLLCGTMLGCFAWITVSTWAFPTAEVPEGAAKIYFQGGEKQLRAEINHTLDLINEKSRVIEIQPVLQEGGYVYCLYLTDTGRFGDVYYPENENWVKWIELSEGERIDHILPEMNKAIAFSEYKNDVKFDDQFSPLLSLEAIIDYNSVTNTSITLGAASSMPTTLYAALADVEIVEEEKTDKEAHPPS